MRGTPLLVQILFIYFVLPSFGISIPAFWSGIIALTLNCAAYISEIFRAGIISIDAGQMEAARSLGMTLFAGHAPHHPAANFPPRRSATDQRSASRC